MQRTHKGLCVGVLAAHVCARAYMCEIIHLNECLEMAISGGLFCACTHARTRRLDANEQVAGGAPAHYTHVHETRTQGQKHNADMCN